MGLTMNYLVIALSLTLKLFLIFVIINNTAISTLYISLFLKLFSKVKLTEMELLGQSICMD
jgi:hypothetical protein